MVVLSRRLLAEKSQASLMAMERLLVVEQKKEAEKVLDQDNPWSKLLPCYSRSPQVHRSHRDYGNDLFHYKQLHYKVHE